MSAGSALPQNLVLLASAGAGKTHAIISAAIGALVARTPPLAPHNLTLITFTVKAAGELRDRLRQRLKNMTPEREPELARLLAERGVKFPSSENALALSLASRAAFAGTFHSFANTVLERAPNRKGVLDERAPAALLDHTIRATVREAIAEGGLPRELAIELGYDELVTALKEVVPRVREEQNPEPELGAPPRDRAAFALLARVQKNFEAALRDAELLDYTSLLLSTRDLLRDDLALRRRFQDRIRLLLVDEFQDTNRLQLEILQLLAEEREGGPRTLPVEELPLEPGVLVVVGDTKQAIYGFRGADAELFGKLREYLNKSGSREEILTTSYRSSPKLLAELNPLLTRLGFGGDNLTPNRKESPEGPAILRLEPPADGGNAEMNRAAEAKALAAFLADVLNGRSIISKHSGNHIAVLFRRLTKVEVYREELVRYGVPHQLVNGSGFFGTREVADVAAFLRLIENPSDELTMAQVLRGPLVNLPDRILFPLFAKHQTGERHEALMRILADEPQALRERYRAFNETFQELSEHGERLGLTQVLQHLFDTTALRANTPPDPFRLQTLANFEKILELARQRERDSVGIGEFALELKNGSRQVALAEVEPSEPMVTLCSVHQAKGLEWPIVVLVDLESGRLPNATRILVERGLPVAVAPPKNGTKGESKSPTFERAKAAAKEAQLKERLRLLYVALTRARDHLVLGHWQKDPESNSWAQLLQEPVAELQPAMIPGLPPQVRS